MTTWSATEEELRAEAGDADDGEGVGGVAEHEQHVGGVAQQVAQLREQRGLDLGGVSGGVRGKAGWGWSSGEAEGEGEGEGEGEREGSPTLTPSLIRVGYGPA